MNMESKRLYKSRSNRMICGVCGGVAEYLKLDPTIIRLLFALFCFLGGSGILVYIIAAIIIPEEPIDGYN
jgi:phage shock protein C